MQRSMDLEKAYDTVNNKAFSEILTLWGVIGRLLNTFKNFYNVDNVSVTDRSSMNM